MDTRQPLRPEALRLPDEVRQWTEGARLYESSGESGARTVFIDRDEGAYLKMAAPGALSMAATMQRHFALHGLSSSVLLYLSLPDRDYMITAALRGEDGTHPRHLAQPDRLCDVFALSLRQLHATPMADCPVQDRMAEFVRLCKNAAFAQSHLDDIAGYIGPADAAKAAAEIQQKRHLLRNDALLHGDYCLPNIIVDGWRLQGFIDVALGGIGDRHYDLAWGLWTLNWNLHTPAYGRRFLDAYGRELIDPDRLRVCALLAAMD